MPVTNSPAVFFASSDCRFTSAKHTSSPNQSINQRNLYSASYTVLNDSA